jgi:hypothetical protein
MKGVDFEKMLCGLLCLARNIEGVFFDVMKGYMKDKNKTYNNLPLQSLEEMYAALEVNIPDTYVFNLNTKVIVFDVVKKTNTVIKLSNDEHFKINETNALSRGSIIYDLYKKKNLDNM